MKVLFVSSGNSKFGIIPFIKSQGDSLKKVGVELEFYTLKGKGATGYAKNILKLRRYLTQNHFDIIHAHYSLTAFVASISSYGKRIPMVVSLMGSDTESGKIEKLLIKLFNKLFWSYLIVKSRSMQEKISIDKVTVLPNGVDHDTFCDMDMDKMKVKHQMSVDVRYVLFAADPSRYSKNFKLAKEAFELAKIPNSQLKVIHDIPHYEIAEYLNASSIVLLTSRYEGSPNIIKEAMSCNRPIVTTNVGDVEWVIGQTEGCYICNHDATELSDHLKKAMQFCQKYSRTNGFERIKELSLDNISIAKKLHSIYLNIV